MPNIYGGEHVISLFLDMGYARSGEPLSCAEVSAWCILSGVKLDSWTATAVSMVSSCYMNQYMKSKKRECPAPYSPESKKDARQVGADVTAKFKAMAQRRVKR
jgi:hypothetical protein